MKAVTKVLSAALLAAAVSVSTATELNLKWSGAAQYRGRLDMDFNKGEDGKKEDAVINRSNKYAWKLGVKASVNENLGLAFQLENGAGYIMTNTVSNNGAFYKDDATNLVRIARAYMSVKKGGFHFNGGIIPVNGNTALDVAYRIDAVGVDMAPEMSDWAVFMANRQTGAEVGFKLGENAGINLVAATLSTDGKMVADQADSLKVKDDMRFYVNAPIKLGGATLTPALNVITGKMDSWTSLSVSGGVDVKIKASDAVSISGGIAVGGYGAADSDQPIALLGVVKPTFKVGEKGKLTTGLSYGWAQKRAAGDDAFSVNTIYGDIKYGISPVKKFTVMPRLRTWYKFNTKENDDSVDFRLRPEILFIASF